MKFTEATFEKTEKYFLGEEQRMFRALHSVVVMKSFNMFTELKYNYVGGAFLNSQTNIKFDLTLPKHNIFILLTSQLRTLTIQRTKLMPC
jgi:hypothetical protein